MSGCGRDGKFTVHDPESWRGSLASRVVTLEDRGREIESRLGFRPYSLWVIRTASTGATRRGDGPEALIQEVAILPSPRISDLTGVTLLATPAMVQEQGSILVSEISGRYTEDQLRFRAPDGSPHGQGESVFWEIAFLPGCPGGGERMRFQATSLPSYNADLGSWSISLTKAYENRARNGTLR